MNKQERKQQILVVAFGIIGILFVTNQYMLSNRIMEIQSTTNEIKYDVDRILYSNHSAILKAVKNQPNTIKKIHLLGLYNDKNDFYCVSTKDRNYCDIMDLDPSTQCINKTSFHELTHWTINNYHKGKDHFCKD